MENLAIHTQGLTKIYKGELGQKSITGLEELSCDVKIGEVYAFLGPNGAGKTTTIKLLTRLLYPTSGKIWIFGRENTGPASMKKVGYLPEQPRMYGYLSGREFMDFISRLFGLDRSIRKKRIMDLMERVGLSNKSDILIRNYSRGMMQRLGLAQALINDPKLLILDEPMAGLDPVGRLDFRNLILELKKDGKTIFFSSHILSDAEMIADRVGILNQGRLVTVGRLDELVSSKVTSVEITFILDPDKLSKTGLKQSELVIQGSRVMVHKEEGDIPEFLRQIDRWNGKVVSVIPRRMSLEEYFMAKVRR
jgi:ABC-2 type transport system ATP-binding protein